MLFLRLCLPWYFLCFLGKVLNSLLFFFPGLIRFGGRCEGHVSTASCPHEGGNQKVLAGGFEYFFHLPGEIIQFD